MDKRKKQVLILSVTVVVLLIIASVIMSVKEPPKDKKEDDNTKVEETLPSSYKIEGVTVLKQEDLKAGCETYACTMLLQSQGIDMDEFEFADKYLLQMPIYGVTEDDWYGPDMDSAYAGEIEWGYGVNSPAMGKFMNQMLKDKGSKKKAYVLKDVPLEQLCKDYIVNDLPVMIWATTNMQEPYVKRYWSINYVDPEISDAQIGDTEAWLQNEHCLVLIGYDEDNYYFADSVAGEVSVFDKETTKDKYEKIESQAIVVK